MDKLLEIRVEGADLWMSRITVSMKIAKKNGEKVLL